MLIKQHKYRWAILKYAIICFISNEPHKYFTRLYPKENSYKRVAAMAYELPDKMVDNGFKKAFAVAIKDIGIKYAKIKGIINE